MRDHVLPRVKSKFKLPTILHRTVLTMGMGESWLSERIDDWANALPSEIKLAYLPSPGRVRLRLSAFGSDESKLSVMLEKEVKTLIKLIPELVFGFDNDTIQSVVGNLLRESSKTIATAESCTGGLIAHKLTSVSGSSDYFLGSIVSYANEVKMESLGVSEQNLIDFGAVSEEVVVQMAEGVKSRMKTDYAISVSGVAGPNGGTDEKPVGTVWTAIAGPLGVITKKHQFGHDRVRNIEISANAALNLLRKSLIASN
ncbi:MAG: nicotinamide-nucleotide amidase [Bacteroidia bacterium]|jgi:nicotinamide-nucleotide amidase